MKLILVLLAIVAFTAGAHVRPVKPVTKVHLNHIRQSGPIKGSGSRIIGGNEVVPNSVPHQVGLFLGLGYFCGGSLISTQWVLTAGHCGVLDDTPTVVLGAHRINNANEATQVRITGRSTVHENYDEVTLGNDITVISIPTVTLNNNIQPIALVGANAPSFDGVVAYETGWGHTYDSESGIHPVLMNTSNVIINNTECATWFGDIIVDGTLCQSSTGSGICQGDSGGPLSVFQDGKQVEVGITSFTSSRGCESGVPNGFTRVSYFRNWIKDHTGI